MGTNSNLSILASARLQKQNGQIVVQILPEKTLGAPGGTPNCSDFRAYSLPGTELLLIRQTNTNNLVMETLNVTASGIATTRAASVIAVTTNSFMDAALVTPDTLTLITQIGNRYYLAEISLTATAFNVAQNYTICAGAFTATSYVPHIIPLSPYDFACIATPPAGGKLHWVKRGNAGRSIGGILENIATRCGLMLGDLNLTAGTATLATGFAITEPMSGRRAAESLLAAYPFALAESDYVLRLTDLRAATSTVLAATATRASDKADPSPISISRKERRDLPRALALSFYDADRDYQPGSARAALDADPQASADTTQLPLVLTAADAQDIAHRLLANAQAEQSELSISLSRDWLALDSGDLLDWQGQVWRVLGLTQRGGLLQLTGRGFSANSLTAPANSLSRGGSIAPAPIIAASLVVLDLPALRDTDDAPGCYFAVSADANWPGGSLFDQASTEKLQFSGPALVGSATTLLAAGTVYTLDRASSVTVFLPHGTLTSCSDADLVNGANLVLIGSEILQFQTATLAAPQTWQLTNLLRGRYGTEGRTGLHAIGDRFVLLEEDTLRRLPLSLTDRGRSESLSLVAFGGSPDDALPQTVTYDLAALQPYAPARLTAQKETSGDLTIRWVRRARLNNGWADYIDVPLDDTVESYTLDILSGSTVVRSITTGTPGYIYTAAQQIADFGGMVTSLSIRVAQIATRYGRGRAADATFTF